MKLPFLWVVCANSLVDSPPYKYVSYLWSLIWSNRIWGSWNLMDFVASGQLFLQTDFTKRLFQTLFLDSPFQNHSDSVILQKYQWLSNQSCKHNLALMPSLNLTPKPSSKPRFCMFIINSYYTKSRRLWSLYSLFIVYWGQIWKWRCILPRYKNYE